MYLWNLPQQQSLGLPWRHEGAAIDGTCTRKEDARPVGVSPSRSPGRSHPAPPSVQLKHRIGRTMLWPELKPIASSRSSWSKSRYADHWESSCFQLRHNAFTKLTTCLLVKQVLSAGDTSGLRCTITGACYLKGNPLISLVLRVAGGQTGSSQGKPMRNIIFTA